MTVYPQGLDTDDTLTRVDDNITEIGGNAINQLRSAVFAIEQTLGIGPAGSVSSVATRLNNFSNADGSVKTSALTAVGLATLPISDSQVGSHAGIKENKLALDYSTGNLHTLIISNTTLLNSLAAFANITFSDLTAHITGAQLLTDSSPARHVLSQIDLNAIPADIRDKGFVWDGLKDQFGIMRTAINAGQALDQINTDLINHENSTAGAHEAIAITVDTSNFQELPLTTNTVQALADAVDDLEVFNLGIHRSTQHANGIPPTARSQSLTLADGYREVVVPSTPVQSFLVHRPATNPVDNLSSGDDLIKFLPIDNSTFNFDAQFSQVKAGDQVRINYGNGLETIFLIDSIRYTPGSEWIVRINGTNLIDDAYASAQIDRALYDTNTYGVLAVAASNATPTGSFSSLLNSVIIGNPRGAMVKGLGFDGGQIDATHYKLYLEFYPTGNPIDKVLSLPFIDVSGNAGTTIGLYTLDQIIQNANDGFRKIGYNYRFIAFNHEGEFGLMLADTINNASFAIINGNNSSGTLTAGIYTENIIGDAIDQLDALGLGSLKAGLASPTFQTTFIDSTAAQLPTKVISPLKHKFFYVNGQRKDAFAPTYLANPDGSWDGYISARNQIGSFTVETTYTINLNLEASGLKAGKTLITSPAITFTDEHYSDVDYGRFIIKNVNFIKDCDTGLSSTEITVINSISGTGIGFGFSSSPTLPIKLYFSYDSVGFDTENVIDLIPTSTPYSRLYEIAIDQTGKTFSHERGRMPRQGEDDTPGFLGNSKFHLLNISSKLRGYRDNISTLNKYVRLYITSYDITTGEYDGYLGQRVSAISKAIINVGPLTTGKRNIPTKFYDETGVDYIEILYFDQSSSTTTFLSENTSRFVDIELFPSLKNDPEVMVLATTEVCWTPVINQNIIQYIIDRREFGSISELEFTKSAQDYISALASKTQENGVFQGLTLVSIDGADNRILQFNGGQCCVNGKFLTVNNQKVIIPRIWQSTLTLPQTQSWVICVNDKGQLIPLILTALEKQYIATDGTYNNYIDSTSLSNLVLNRKNLLPIATITSHIASFTINSSDVIDIRRMLVNQGMNTSLSWTSDTGYGHFNSFAGLARYIKLFNGTNNKVLVKGNFTIDTPIDLTKFTSVVELEGAGATFTITGVNGFLLDSNIILRKLNFIYSPPNTGILSNNLVNSGNGCLYSAASDNNNEVKENIIIENCTFTCPVAYGRPSFINFELQPRQVLTRVRIANNNFNDDNIINQHNCGIAIINLNSLPRNSSAILQNCWIDQNCCMQSQGIVVSTVASGAILLGFGKNFAAPGMKIVNSIISNNQCGIIGYMNSFTQNVFGNTDGYISSSGLNINDNAAEFIATVDGATGTNIGNGLNFDLGFASGDVSIFNNKVHWITAVANNIGTEQRGSLRIANNLLTAFDTSYGTTYYGLSVSFPAAILVATGDAGNTAQVSITDNIIDINSVNGSDFTYLLGIVSSVGATIHNNRITSIATGGAGIKLTASTNSQMYIITNNRINRRGNSIFAYIGLGDLVSATSSGIITNNFFDSNTIDGGTNTNLIFNPPSTWTINQNIGQTYTITVDATSGFIGIVDSGITTSSTLTGMAISIASSVNNGANVYWSMDAGTPREYIWEIPLIGIVPYGASILNVSITATYQSTTSGTLLVSLGRSADIPASQSHALASETSHLFSINQAQGVMQMVQGNVSGLFPRIQVYGSALVDAGVQFVNWSTLSITYGF